MKAAVCLFLLLLMVQAQAAPMDDAIRAEMSKRHIPGLSLAVLKQGKVIAMRNYGLANMETGTAATSQTVYKIASLSKAFIADAILLLAQEGKLVLDDRAAKFLPDAPDAWRDITVRQLLNHTSGIVRDPPDYHPYEPQPIMAVIRTAYTLSLASPPGEKYLYSNIGYYVLAEILSRVSGQSWDAYIAAHFFAPAGMTATRITTQEIVPNRAGGYYWRNNRYVNAEDWIAVRPSGAFLSTAQDMARWDRFQRSPHFPVNAQTRAEAEKPAHLNDGSFGNYGFGWAVDKFLSQTRIHHDGTYPGFRSDYEKLGNDLSVILLTNSENGSVESLALKIAGFFDPSLVMPRFTLSADARTTAQAGMPVAIAVAATDLDRPAPGSLVEMEIWDATGKAVFKQHKADENFAAGETRRYAFSWVPKAPGTYTISVGAYGPAWVSSYAWSEKIAAIRVN